MYDFLLQTIVFASLGLVIFLLARTLPRLSEEVASTEVKNHYFDRFIKKLPLEKIDSTLNSFIGKALRRTKIVILKVDNLLNRYLNKNKKNDAKLNTSNEERNPKNPV